MEFIDAVDARNVVDYAVLDLDTKDYLRFQIYKNRSFNRSLGKEFYKTLEYFKSNFDMSYSKALTEIRNNEFGKFVAMNHGENVELIFRIVDHIFRDDDYRGILVRFCELFDVCSVTEAKILLDDFEDMAPEYKKLKISDKIDSLCAEYRKYMDLRQMIYQRFLNVCSEHDMDYHGSEYTLVQQLTEGGNSRLLQSLTPKIVPGGLGGQHVPLKMGSKVKGKACTSPSAANAPTKQILHPVGVSFSPELMKLLMVVACLTVHDDDGNSASCPFKMLRLQCLGAGEISSPP